MPFDYLGLAATLVSSTFAASVGAFFSARFGSVQRERAEAAEQRRETANVLIDRLTELKGLFRSAEHSREVRVWRLSIEATYDAFDDARHRLPVRLRHLKRSIRYAIGEATALSFVDHWRSGDDESDDMAPYNYRWTTYAIEYVDMAVNSLRRWRDCDQRVADKVRAPDFDDWLRETGRHVPGEASTESG
jgi:hypothetical protein